MLFNFGVSIDFVVVSSIIFTSFASYVLEFTLDVNVYKHISDYYGYVFRKNLDQ
jgi:hypothetical protein